MKTLYRLLFSLSFILFSVALIGFLFPKPTNEQLRLELPAGNYVMITPVNDPQNENKSEESPLNNQTETRTLLTLKWEENQIILANPKVEGLKIICSYKNCKLKGYTDFNAIPQLKFREDLKETFEFKLRAPGILEGQCIVTWGGTLGFGENKQVCKYILRQLPETLEDEAAVVQAFNSLSQTTSLKELPIQLINKSGYTGTTIGLQIYPDSLLYWLSTLDEETTKRLTDDFQNLAKRNALEVDSDVANSLEHVFHEDFKSFDFITEHSTRKTARCTLLLNRTDARSKSSFLVEIAEIDGKWQPQRLAIPYRDSNDWDRAHLIYDRRIENARRLIKDYLFFESTGSPEEIEKYVNILEAKLNGQGTIKTIQTTIKPNRFNLILTCQGTFQHASLIEEFLKETPAVKRAY